VFSIPVLEPNERLGTTANAHRFSLLITSAQPLWNAVSKAPFFLSFPGLSLEHGNPRSSLCFSRRRASRPPAGGRAPQRNGCMGSWPTAPALMSQLSLDLASRRLGRPGMAKHIDQRLGGHVS